MLHQLLDNFILPLDVILTAILENHVTELPTAHLIFIVNGFFLLVFLKMNVELNVQIPAHSIAQFPPYFVIHLLLNLLSVALLRFVNYVPVSLSYYSQQCVLLPLL